MNEIPRRAAVAGLLTLTVLGALALSSPGGAQAAPAPASAVASRAVTVRADQGAVRWSVETAGGWDGRAGLALLAPPSHADARDAGDSPLDVREVGFGQQGTRLVLSVRTQRPWAAGDLGAARTLCVLISRTGDFAPAARLCVGSSAGRAALRFQAAPGARPRRVAATLSRPDGRTLRAGVLPSALGLGLGPLRWLLASRWSDAAGCATGCEDRVPDTGAFGAAIAALGAPRCFGAAARARRGRCRNPLLRTTVYPRPSDAAIMPNSPCTPLARPGAALDPCAFGVTGAQRRATVALIGDSHAAHWRPAIEVVAQVLRWRGVSITRPGCPFSERIPSSPALGPGACLAQHTATIAWLRAHPTIRTIFVSDWAEPASGPQGGTAGYGGDAAAFGAMLDRVPASVRRIYVLRDIPATTLSSTVCVERRLAHARPTDSGCSAPRSAVLTPDPGATAAMARRPRARVLDLTHFFCGPTRCYPVIGGVYVHKDDSHMNTVFATTLGPFLLKALPKPT